MLERQERAGRKNLGPPGANRCRTGKSVANQDRIVARSVQPAIDRIMLSRLHQRPTALEHEVRIKHEVAFIGRLENCGPGRRGSAGRPGCGIGHDSHFAATPATSTLPAETVPLAAVIAWSRSERMSRISSIPTESRTISGV